MLTGAENATALIECTVNLKIISATRFVIVPNLPPKDACQEKAKASPRLRRWRRGARWARRKLARAPRAVRIVGVVAILLAARRADEPRLSRDPQADRAVASLASARQGAGRDVAAIRAAVPRLFHQHDHARIAGRAGAGREFGQSGGAHLLALAIEPQSVRNLPARLQRRRPLPDDRCGLRRDRAVLYPRQAVTDTGCGFTGLYIRAIPSHAIELASVYLDRNVAAVLAREPEVRRARSRSRISPPSSISAAPVPPQLSRAATFK